MAAAAPQTRPFTCRTSHGVMPSSDGGIVIDWRIIRHFYDF